LAIVNNATKTLVSKCLYYILTYISSDICPGVVLLNHMAVPFLVFLRSPILFSIVVVPVYIPTNSIWGFLFPHILKNICYCLCSWW
jgi:hypothetical protein